MKQFGKKLLKHPLSRGVISLLISLLLRVIYLTSKTQMIVPESAEPFVSGERQSIFCFWHGNMIMQVFKRPKNRCTKVLISHHRDGALITDVLQWFDVGTVRGSTKKAGVSAMRELLAEIDAGTNIVITPDGPRGPVHQIVGGGAAWVSSKTKLPLIPVAFAATKGRQFSSWDRFFLPFFFSHITYVVGEPIMVDQLDSEEAANIALRESLMQCMEQAAYQSAQQQ